MLLLQTLDAGLQLLQLLVGSVAAMRMCAGIISKVVNGHYAFKPPVTPRYTDWLC
jgi:hypothetical protein